LRKPKPI
jgi:hypothetical protein